MWHRVLHRAGNFKCSWQKILPRNRAHSNSFSLNNIAYLSQIIVNVHNDFTLGYKLCIVHFSAKRLSFCGSNTVCMLHIERSNTDRAFAFRLLCFFKLRTSSSFVPYSSFLKQTYVRLICLLNKQFRPLLELNVTRLVCVWNPWLLLDAVLRFCTVCHLHICIYFD